MFFCFFCVNFLRFNIKINVCGFGDVILMYLVIVCWVFVFVSFVLNILGVLIIIIFLLNWLVNFCEYFFVIEINEKVDGNICLFNKVFLVVFFLDFVFLISVILILFFV